jgi:hypothetical protein
VSDMARFLQENSCISSEVSDQNFAEETKGIGESRGYNQKRLKSADDTMNDQVEESVCTV